MKVVINPKYEAKVKDFIESLPYKFMSEGEVLYHERNVIKVFKVDDLVLNVKAFKKPHLLNQVVYGNFRKSKAERSYLYASMLIDRGFNTPYPIAYLEYKSGILLTYSAYVSIHEEFDGIMQELLHGTLEEHKELITEFAQYTASLHKAKILHLDYSPGNILFKKKDNGKYYFYLVDLNRMKFDIDISIKEASESFRRLWGSDEMISYFAAEYAKCRGFDVEQCVEETFKYRHKFWTAYERKYPGATPYEG